MNATQEGSFYAAGWRLNSSPDVGGVGHIVDCYDAIKSACDRWNQKEPHIHHYPVMVSEEWIACWRAIVIKRSV